MPAFADPPLTVANEALGFIRPGRRGEAAVLSRSVFIAGMAPAVIDAASLELIEVARLHAAVDHTRSATGSAVLLRSLIQPSTDLGHIRSKQLAVGELQSDNGLRRALEDYVHAFSRTESALFKLFNKGLYALSPYADLKRARRAAAGLVKGWRTLPGAQSPYLKSLLARLQAYAGSPVDRLMNGPVYLTFTGLKSRGEVGRLTPKLRFLPRRFSMWLLAGPAIFAAPHVQHHIGAGPPLAPMLSTIGIAWTGAAAFYTLFVKPVRDTGKFIEPLRARAVSDPTFGRAIDAVGQLDELLSLCAFARRSPYPTCAPKVTDVERHSFEAKGLVNPVLAADKADIVPNAVDLNGARLTFISGPNSGGKTTLCKSIVHNQLLAQAGGHVLAERAAINIAETIRYQAPKFDGLQDQEGRFGTELGRTRDIFYATGPKSLVILDELAEGTTYEEGLDTADGILRDFHTIGNNTLLVTHNHGLVDRFVAEGTGRGLRAEFDGDAPTYRIVAGISRVSHADKVAERIGFSAADRRRYLDERGYLGADEGPEADGRLAKDPPPAHAKEG
jgi:hypothetical protein